MSDKRLGGETDRLDVESDALSNWEWRRLMFDADCEKWHTARDLRLSVSQPSEGPYSRRLVVVVGPPWIAGRSRHNAEDHPDTGGDRVDQPAKLDQEFHTVPPKTRG